MNKSGYLFGFLVLLSANVLAGIEPTNTEEQLSNSWKIISTLFRGNICAFKALYNFAKSDVHTRAATDLREIVREMKNDPCFSNEERSLVLTPDGTIQPYLITYLQRPEFDVRENIFGVSISWKCGVAE
jgi:hypothetical protein